MEQIKLIYQKFYFYISEKRCDDIRENPSPGKSEKRQWGFPIFRIRMRKWFYWCIHASKTTNVLNIISGIFCAHHGGSSERWSNVELERF